MTSVKRAQSDGTTEVVNRSINTMARLFLNWNQDNWVSMLPIFEFAYNSVGAKW
jgi:hypothetical protein